MVASTAPEHPSSTNARPRLNADDRGMAQRPDHRFVWVDDEISHVDQQWVSTHHPGPALLHRVDPRRGLTEHDFTAIERWLMQAQ